MNITDVNPTEVNPTEMSPAQILANLRTRFDALVARQQANLRGVVALTLRLPLFVDTTLYVTAMRRPVVFVSFLATQMRLAGYEDVAVQFNQEELAIGDSAEALADFIEFRGLFQVFLTERGLYDSGHYTFLHQRPAGDNGGFVQLTLDSAYERSLLNTTYGNNPAVDEATYPFWRVIHLLRLAMPRATLEEALQGLEADGHLGIADPMPRIPLDFCLFASTFLHRAEAVMPGIYEAFRDGPPIVFPMMMMTLYSGTDTAGQIPRANMQAYNGLWRRVIQISGSGALGDFGSDVIDNLRNSGGMMGRVPEAARAALSHHNITVFGDWVEAQNSQTMEALGEGPMTRLNQDLLNMANIIGGEVVWTESDTYVDVDFINTQLGYNNRPTVFDQHIMEGFQPTGEEPEGEVADQEDLGDCFCGNPIGTGPTREPPLNLPCCDKVIGAVCARTWISVRGTCPLCVKPIKMSSVFPSRPVTPSANGGSQPGSPEESEDWFVTVLMPQVRAQYALKWRARHINAPWEGITFTGVDTSVPGPSHNERHALDHWLLTVVRPLVVQETMGLVFA